MRSEAREVREAKKGLPLHFCGELMRFNRGSSSLMNLKHFLHFFLKGIREEIILLVLPTWLCHPKSANAQRCVMALLPLYIAIYQAAGIQCFAIFNYL
jgi:hypothetical protein